MPKATTAPAARPDIDALELATGLPAITAAVLWTGVWMITRGAPELCTSTPSLLAHCPLCYPAAFATLATLVSGGFLLKRRLA